MRNAILQKATEACDLYISTWRSESRLCKDPQVNLLNGDSLHFIAQIQTTRKGGLPNTLLPLKDSSTGPIALH